MGDARKTAAAKLLMHARIAAAVLSGKGRPRFPILTALKAGKTMADLADQVLHDLVGQARAEGCTWEEIGEVLGTTRQAAYQRFGSSA